MPRSRLGELEEQILLTVLRLGGESYAVPVARELGRLTAREVSPATAYMVLRRLEGRGLWSRRWGRRLRNVAADRVASTAWSMSRPCRPSESRETRCSRCGTASRPHWARHDRPRSRPVPAPAGGSPSPRGGEGRGARGPARALVTGHRSTSPDGSELVADTTARRGAARSAAVRTRWRGPDLPGIVG